MTPVMLAGLLLVLWLAAAVIYQITAQMALRRFLDRAPGPQAGRLPSAAILMPLGGMVPNLEGNLARLCAAGAPVIAGMEREGCEALAAAIRVLETTGRGTLRIVEGSRATGSNRKVATLIHMMNEARGEIVVFVDGDIGVPGGYREALLAPFADPQVGMVTCPYRSVRGATAASRLDALMTNTAFLPSVTLAARVEGVRFALGATMAIRRDVLDQVGGLEPLLETLADDWCLADRARRTGCRIVLAPVLLDHHVGEPRWSVMWLRHLRWARTMRAVRPSGYAGTIVTHGCAPALGLALLGGGSLAAGALALWALVRASTVLLNARRIGCDALDVLLLPVADILSLALFVGGLWGRTVHWGDSRLRVGPGGAILAAGARHEGSPQTDYGTWAAQSVVTRPERGDTLPNE